MINLAPEEENLLEKILRLACDEPAHTPAFFETLLQSQVVLLSTSELLEDAECEFPYVSWPDPEDPNVFIVPCYTSINMMQLSLNALSAEGILPADMAFVGVEVVAEALLRAGLLTEVFFYINPSCDYGKMIAPDEVRCLFSDTPLEVSNTYDEQIELFTPWPMPEDLIFSLSQFLTKHSMVERAYVLYMRYRVTFKSHYLVVFDSDAPDLHKVFVEASRVAARFEFDTTPEPVMFIRLTDSKYIMEYCLKLSTPFYERSWGEKMVLLESGQA